MNGVTGGDGQRERGKDNSESFGETRRERRTYTRRRAAVKSVHEGSLQRRSSPCVVWRVLPGGCVLVQPRLLLVLGVVSFRDGPFHFDEDLAFQGFWVVA